MYTVGLDEQIGLILYSLLFINIAHRAKDNTSNLNNLQPLVLDNKIKEIIFGSLLGDGQIEMPPRGINARFGFTQSKSQEGYFLSVLNELSIICTGKFRENSYTDKRTGKIYTSLSFWSKASPMLNEFYIGFYNGKAKSIPSDLSLLTPLALAHWAAQRGLPCGRSLYLCTEGFSSKGSADVKRLSQYLSDRYSIKCTVHKRAGNYHIYILANSLDNFKNIILPYKLKMTHEYITDKNLSLISPRVSRSSTNATYGRASFSFNMKRPVAFLSKNDFIPRKFFSTKDNSNSCVPVLNYDNADLLKTQAVRER